MNKWLGMMLIAAAAVGAQAGTITLDDADYARLYNTDQAGEGDFAIWQGLSVGTKANNAGWDLHAGFVFQMTGASAADLEAADFSVSLTGGQGTPIYNVDVYVNRVSSTSDFLVSDFENGTKIMDDFVTTSDFGNNGNYSLNSTGEANLLTYLQSNWVEDSYVFITLKTNTDDVTPTPFVMGEDANANYLFGGNNTGLVDEVTDAQLSVTIPEPATIGLVGLVSTAALFIRRLQMG